MPRLCEVDEFANSPGQKVHRRRNAQTRQQKQKRKRKQIQKKSKEGKKMQSTGGADTVPPNDKCTFYGLIWPRLIMLDSEELRWVSSIRTVTGVTF